MIAEKNIYFVMLAKAGTEAEAISEAHRLINATGYYGTRDHVSVRTCGTKKLVANVFGDGSVTYSQSKAHGKENP